MINVNNENNSAMNMWIYEVNKKGDGNSDNN